MGLKGLDQGLKWWGCQDLNLGPIGYEPTALTTELHPLVATYALPCIAMRNLQNCKKNRDNYIASRRAVLSSKVFDGSGSS
jgi:hypothetical protein